MHSSDFSSGDEILTQNQNCKTYEDKNCRSDIIELFQNCKVIEKPKRQQAGKAIEMEFFDYDDCRELEDDEDANSESPTATGILSMLKHKRNMACPNSH